MHNILRKPEQSLDDISHPLDTRTHEMDTAILAGERRRFRRSCTKLNDHEQSAVVNLTQFVGLKEKKATWFNARIDLVRLTT